MPKLDLKNKLALDVLEAMHGVLSAAHAIPVCSFQEWIESRSWEREIGFLNGFRSDDA